AEEFKLRPALAALPTITPVGMAALLPGAAASFAVVEKDERLGARIEEAFLPDLAARKKFLAARCPGAVDLTLDEVLGLSKKKLENRIAERRVVVVRSQEIDLAGETSTPFQARRTMDGVVENLARAVRKLAAVGVADAVIAADHGHLFFAAERDESLRVDSPGGKVVDLHRRCWIGHGGATPPGCVRVGASGLGYASDLEFVFPGGYTVFKSGGDLHYHHGGTSLQEMVVPVLSVRVKNAVPAAGKKDEKLVVTGFPKALTNRIFSVGIELGKQLFSAGLSVRPLLVAGERRVGGAVVAVNAELDRATKCVALVPGKAATVGLMLADDDRQAVPTVRVVVQDANTDAELFRSDEIPVRLGV
ncbi:MAG TPA: PglZ domain-containing protein, partial [Planctomycetota bacterium]|nr:PglZ domain-containing protein [Planctomycetota bacterium]